LFKLQAQLFKERIGVRGVSGKQRSLRLLGERDMIRLYHYYTGYRRVGLRRFDAFRFAWLVAFAGARPAAARQLPRR
jgi:hypothetical protein